MSARRMYLASVAAALVLAGCTTIPDNSTPQVVQPVYVQPADTSVGGPTPGADPRSIVQGFLTANADTDPNHTTAKAYLTRVGRGRWSDQTATVLDRPIVGTVVFGKHRAGVAPDSGTITVSGFEAGTLDETGTYKPFLRGNGSGSGGGQLRQMFGLTKVDGEWRINTPPATLLVTTAQFQAFAQYAVYFFDASEQDLVPTPRYTQRSDPQVVVPWLVQQQLADQPPDQLNTAFPPGSASNVKVTVPPDPSDPSQPIVIEIPGASALDGASLDRLASQIGATLKQVPQVDRIRITDGGKPVRIPSARGTVFSATAVADRYQPVTPNNQLFFVHSGAVYQGSGRRIPGKAGLGAYGLTSVAVTQASSGALEVAGVRGPANDETLDIPSPHLAGSLVQTAVHGELSRPSWAPGRREVWIGNGSNLVRVTGPKSVQSVPLNVPQGKATGQVVAVRISPDGGRVALVLKTGDSSQVYVGTIVRNGNQVSVDNLQPISPQAVNITDVAWNDQFTMFATGGDTIIGGEDQVYEVQCDGSDWTQRGNFELPGSPTSVTAASGSEVVVSSRGSIYQQQGASWSALLNGESLGTNPVYLE